MKIKIIVSGSFTEIAWTGLQQIVQCCSYTLFLGGELACGFKCH